MTGKYQLSIFMYTDSCDYDVISTLLLLRKEDYFAMIIFKCSK